MRELILVPTALEARGIFATTPRGAETLELGRGRVLGLCGFGPAAAGALAARHLAATRPDRVVLGGIAGSHDLGRAPLGALRCAAAIRSQGIGAGQGPAHLGAEDLGFGEAPEGLGLLDLRPWPGVAAVTVVGVAAASGSAAEAAELRRRHPGVVLEDMESWAVALACAAFAAPLVVLRAVSNRAGDRRRENWRVAEALAALRAAFAGAC